MTPPTPDLRQYLTAAYSDDELITLCADYFRDVYENFASGMTKGQKIQLLLDHCQHRDLFANLESALERDRPDQFRARFAATAAEPRPARTRPQRDPRQVFISHAHQDAEFAHRLAADLQAQGWRVWIAPDSIRPGEKWVEAINRGLAESAAFVVALTPAAVDSQWVTHETDAAIMLMNKGRLRFIPVELECCEAPPLWEVYHWISFRDGYAAGLTALLAVLNPGAAGSAETIPAQPRAQTGSVGDRPERGSPPGTRPEPVEGPPPAPAAASTRPGGQSASGTRPEPVEGSRVTPAVASTRSASGSRPTPTEGRRPEPAEGPPAILTLTAPIRLRLIRIPAGEFVIGSDPAVDKGAQDNEKPQHRLYLPDFYIGKVPVTNAQFEVFVKLAGHKTSAEKQGSGWVWTGSKWDDVKGADWRHPRGPQTGIADKGDHPVVQVSWHDAVAFCRWLSEATGQPFHLPTEAEWEKAARGPVTGASTSSVPSTGSGRGRIYPWGDAPSDKTRCNFGRNVGDTTPVGQYAAGATPDTGVLDLAGNVWEWTGSLWGKDVQKPDFGYPYKPGDGRENQAAPDSVLRIVRGGSWWSDRTYVRCACRDWGNPDDGFGSIGFRVARSSP